MRYWSLIVPLTALTLAISACQTPAERAAADVAAKNAAARGGLEAWRKVQTLSISGTLDAGTPRDPVKLAMSYTKSPDQIRAEERRIARQAEALAMPFVNIIGPGAELLSRFGRAHRVVADLNLSFRMKTDRIRDAFEQEFPGLQIFEIQGVFF